MADSDETMADSQPNTRQSDAAENDDKNTATAVKDGNNQESHEDDADTKTANSQPNTRQSDAAENDDKNTATAVKGGGNQESHEDTKTSARESGTAEAHESNAEKDGRTEQKKYFREELNRLKTSLNEEASKIVQPPIKKHFPYIFNTLEPYYNTFTAKYLIESPDEVSHAYASRRTALGLCDPWVNLDMDEDVISKGESKPINRQELIAMQEEKRADKSPRGPKEGSTRLPKFPMVSMDTNELATKKLYYSDVPMLRDELHKKYSMNAQEKIERDYKRTTQDFYRMDLDKLDEVHPVNRGNLRKSYFAYLQNTPGSKKAVKECVKNLASASS